MVSVGLVLSEEKIFEKVYDVRRMPSDGNSSHGPFGSGELIKSLENLYKCYLTYVGKPAQLCFDVMALRMTGPGQDSTTDFS